MTYSWISLEGAPVDNADQATATVYSPGQYQLTITDPANGCSATNTVTVEQDISEPLVDPISATGTELTCYVTELTFTGNSTTTGATYQWTNEAGDVLSTLAEVTVTGAGTYTLTTTGPNGCTTPQTQAVTQTLDAPVATASVNDVLDCLTDHVILEGSSTGAPVTYRWDGPNGYSTTTQNPEAYEAGTYTLTITTAAGCTDTDAVIVEENKTAPGIDRLGWRPAESSPRPRSSGR
jgi:hypothetical protein